MIKKLYNLSECELNTKNNEEVYAKMMLWLLLLNSAEVKKNRWKKNRWVQKKLKIPRFWDFALSRTWS